MLHARSNADHYSIGHGVGDIDYPIYARGVNDVVTDLYSHISVRQFNYADFANDLDVCEDLNNGPIIHTFCYTPC